VTVPRRLSELRAGEGSRTEAEAEAIAAALRERIYATLVAAAALAALLKEKAHATAPEAIASVTVTVLGLWTASLFSEGVAHSAVHGHWPDRAEWLHIVRAAAQILSAVALPEALLLAAWVGWLPLDVAVISGIVLLVLGIAVLSWFALRNSGLHLWSKLLVVAIEMAIGLAIVAVKLVAH
jgi:hypothetical protein